MEDLIGLLVFVVIAIFSGLAKYRESQKSDSTPPPPPKPFELPEATRRQYQRREIRTAMPAQPAEQRPRPPTGPARTPGPAPAPRVAQPVPVRPTQQPVRPQQPAARTAQQPQQRVAQQRPTLTPLGSSARAGREAARQSLEQAVSEGTDTGQAEAAAKRERQAQGVPVLFRSMEGIRAGIVFNEIFNPPLSLR